MRPLDRAHNARMTNASGDRPRTEHHLLTDVSDTIHVTLEGVREAMSRTRATGNEREREIDRAVRLTSVSAQLINAFSKLRCG